MRILYLSERNIGSLSVVRMIQHNDPQDFIVLENLENFNGKLVTEHYDLCIMDGNKLDTMPLKEFPRLILEPNVPIVILANKWHSLHRVISNLNNVRGVIRYESDVDFFLSALKVVRTGGYCYSWDIYAIKEDKSVLLDEEYCVSVGLTRREIEILKMLYNGATNKEISIKLSRSQKTISAHKANILRKTGTKRLPIHST